MEYYLSDTSNNGKTITKPITASQGGYYTFNLGHNPGVGIRQADNVTVGGFAPNPARDAAVVTIQSEAVRCTVCIVAPDGRVAPLPDAASSGIYKVDVRGLASGLYHVVFTAPDGSRTVRPLAVE